MTYEPEDEQPSIFFLRESPRQAMLTVFNWTSTARSHTLNLEGLGFSAGHTVTMTDVMNQNAPSALAGSTVRLDVPPQSVKVIKLIDTSVAEAAPTNTPQVPSAANAGETIHMSAQTDADGVPAVSYHWDFGDGTTAEGAQVSHCYTRAADFTVRVTVNGVDGVPAEQNFRVRVTGNLKVMPKLTDNRRFVEPTER
jgi:hypothetical protein